MLLTPLSGGYSLVKTTGAHTMKTPIAAIREVINHINSNSAEIIRINLFTYTYFILTLSGWAEQQFAYKCEKGSRQRFTIG